MNLTDLLEIWRKSRDPKVAELIATAEPRPKAVLAFEAVTTGGLPGVLERLGSLDVPADPRIGRFLVTLIARYRGWDTPLARRVHQRAFELLAIHADVEVAGHLTKLAETKGVTTRWFEAEVRSVVAALGATVPAPLEVGLPDLKVTTETADSNRRRTALYAAVYEAPDDDAARAVLADFLLQEQDPHGELIAAQLAPPTPSTTKRVRELLRGDLATFVNPRLWRVLMPRSIVFERGFAAAGNISPRSAGDLDRAIGVPAWATVNALQLPNFAGWQTKPEDTARMIAFLTHPVMSGLRRVGPIGRAELVALIEHGKPLPWRDLAVERRIQDPIDYYFEKALERLEAVFPSLERFEPEA